MNNNELFRIGLLSLRTKKKVAQLPNIGVGYILTLNALSACRPRSHIFLGLL